MIKNIFKILLLSFVVLLTGCLKTRSEVSGQDQDAVYGKKMAVNQMDAQVATTPIVSVEEKDELIRGLNGRVEVLENQLNILVKEKESQTSGDSQKITLLQEALAKMELQVQRFENELPAGKTNDKNLISSDEAAAAKSDTPKSDSPKSGSAKKEVPAKKLGTYDTAEQNFSNQEWKRAILNFQKYTDESPRGKNVPDAKYKIGVCFQELGMKEEAMAFYEEVVANHAKTSAGKKSKARLGSLKK